MTELGGGVITRAPSRIGLNILSIDGVCRSPESGSFTEAGSSPANEFKFVSSDSNIVVFTRAEVLPGYSLYHREPEPRLEEDVANTSRIKRLGVPERIKRAILEKMEGG
jgi:hypothetical protein